MRRCQPWLGTLVEITLDDDADPRAIERAFAEIALVDSLMSFHSAQSDLSRFNRAGVGALLDVHAHTWQVLRLADDMLRASSGLFNVACAPQLVAWGSLPAPDDAAPLFVPGRRVYQLEANGQVRKCAPGWLDLGGIAKGYAVDLAIAALAGSACVNAGGDLRVTGPRAWPVTIRSPHAPQQGGASLELRDAALATSATYFSATRALVDTRDGSALVRPVSVSVHASTCAVADALTKVVMASGDASHPALAAFGASAFII